GLLPAVQPAEVVGIDLGDGDGTVSEIGPGVPLLAERFVRTMRLMMTEGTSTLTAATRIHGATPIEATRSQRPIVMTPAMLAQNPVSSAASRSSARWWNPEAIRTMMPRP